MRHAREDYNRIQDPENKIPEDEPVFLIRAQDRVGSAVVKIWAQLAEDNGASHEIVQKARDHASLMEKWAVKKTPDLPELAITADLCQTVVNAKTDVR